MTDSPAQTLAATVRHETHLIRTAIGFALAEKNIPREPQWTQLVPSHLDKIDAALASLVALADGAAQLEAEKRCEICQSAIEATLAAEAENERLREERQRLGDELDAYSRSSFEEKDRFISALEIEQRDKGFAIARAEAAEERAAQLEAERDELLERDDENRRQMAQYDTALAVLDGSTEKIGDEWIEEYRWKTGAYHKILGFRPKIMSLAGEFGQYRERAVAAEERVAAFQTERDEAQYANEIVREQQRKAEAERDYALEHCAEAEYPTARPCVQRAMLLQARVTELEAANAELTVIAQVAHDVIIKEPDDVQKEFLTGISRGVAALANEETP